MTTDQLVRLDIDDNLATITLARAAKKNAFNDDMMSAFGKALDQVNGHSDIRTVTIAAEGDIFCSGLDLAGANFSDPAATLETVWKPTILKIANSDKIYIAAINGPAIGFGGAIALVCDICLMSNQAFFQFPFVSFGWVADCGLTWALTRQMGPKKALEYLATTDRIDAHQAVTLGLVNRAVPSADLQETTETLSKKIARQAPLALKYIKSNINAATTQSREDNMSLEAQVQGELFASKDAAEAMKAFIEKRPPNFTGQ